MTVPKLNQSIWSIPMPDRIKRLPISATCFLVPWFVHWQDGKPDFRVIGPDKMTMAVKRSLCWICGQPLDVHKAFLMGPMYAVSRCISGPPSHLECSDYAARACPFLTTPNAKRIAKDLPEERVTPAGALVRNSGAVAVWITKTFPFLIVEAKRQGVDPAETLQELAHVQHLLPA